jgi:hypothetical protein
MSSAIPAQVHRRRWRWVWTVLVLVAGFVGADQVYRLILHRKVTAQLRAFQEKGYPLSGVELGKSVSPLPDAENGALRIIEACDSLVLLPDSFNPDQLPRRGEELGPAERDGLREVLTNNSPVLEAIHSAVQFKQSRFPIDYEQGAGAHLPHLAKIKAFSRLLQAQAYLYSEEGQPDHAVKAITDGVLLARSLEQEPIFISQWIRMACLAMQCTSLERLLNQHALSPGQLAVLAEAFEGAAKESHAAYATGFRGEICLAAFCFTSPPDQSLALLQPEGSGWAAIFKATFPVYAWAGLRERDFLFYLQTMREITLAAKSPCPESVIRAKKIGREIQQCVAAPRFRFISGMMLPILAGSLDPAAELEARLRCAQAALAIEQYRHKHAQALPGSLTQLVPAILPTVPSDAMDGAPLRYRKLTESTAYVVFSVGLDGVDNGGSAGDTRADSEVWRWPPGAQLRHPTGPAAANAPESQSDISFRVER